MKIEFVNLRIIDDCIYANVYENNNYMMMIGAEISHIEYTSDFESFVYKQFRQAVLDYLSMNKNKHLRLIK